MPKFVEKFISYKIQNTMRMSKNLEELRKKFIVREKLDEKRIVEYVNRTLRFGKVAADGDVIVERENMSTRDKVALALIMRFLANHLEKDISAEISVAEVSRMLNLPKDQAAARLTELVDDKVAVRIERGVYKINPSKIGKFLDYLESKYKV